MIDSDVAQQHGSARGPAYVLGRISYSTGTHLSLPFIEQLNCYSEHEVSIPGCIKIIPKTSVASLKSVIEGYHPRLGALSTLIAFHCFTAVAEVQVPRFAPVSL